MSDYSINYEDDRFKNVETEKKQQLTNTENTYNNMISNSDKYYQDQINTTRDWNKTQQDLQQKQTDFAIEQINQQKEQANKDYIKEQKGAYSDWQKQSNKYGVNAENLASSGLANSGFAQSSEVSMWNTYQQRKMTATENYNRAVLNYDNSIKEAQLANNSKLAELAYTALQNELEIALQGFQYKNQLLLQKETQLQSINDNYYNRYKDVLAQINAENSLAEQIRQYNESLAEERRQYNETMAFNKQKAEQEQANWEKQFALTQQQYANSKSSKSSGSYSGSTSSNYKVNPTTNRNGNIGTSAAKAGVIGAINASNGTQLSDNANKLLKVLQPFNNAATKGVVEKNIYQAIQNNMITRDEAEIIINKLNQK